jgi:hypothetical protein
MEIVNRARDNIALIIACVLAVGLSGPPLHARDVAWRSKGTGFLAPAEHDYVPLVVRSATMYVKVGFPDVEHCHVRATYNLAARGDALRQILLAVPLSGRPAKKASLKVNGQPVANAYVSGYSIEKRRRAGLENLIEVWRERHPDVNTELARLAARVPHRLRVQLDEDVIQTLERKCGLEAWLARLLVRYCRVRERAQLWRLATALYPELPLARSGFQLAPRWYDYSLVLDPYTGRLQRHPRSLPTYGLMSWQDVHFIHFRLRVEPGSEYTVILDYLVSGGMTSISSGSELHNFYLLLMPSRYWHRCGPVTVRFDVPDHYSRARFLPEPDIITRHSRGHTYEYRFTDPQENIYAVFVLPAERP